MTLLMTYRGHEIFETPEGLLCEAPRGERWVTGKHAIESPYLRIILGWIDDGTEICYDSPRCERCDGEETD